METRASVSPQLVEANRRLYGLRAQMRANRPAAGPAAENSYQIGDKILWKPQSLRSFETAVLGEEMEALPDHLGWGSDALTSAFKRRREAGDVEAIGRDWLGLLPFTAKNGPKASNDTDEKPQHKRSEACVKVYPDIALGMLRQEQAAAGRLWLLLRYLDRRGQGLLRIVIIKQQLTNKTSNLFICGWRQLRNLLQQGEGIFWQRDKTRVWLRSAAKVAASLGVERLRLRPVSLPLSALLGGIGDFRAHLYASFHSGRGNKRPISRETLEEISGVPARTQREYEEIAGIASRRNIAIGEKYTPESVQKRAWLHGTASFDFIDHHGRQGPEKRHYIAWHLPNSYEGCHPPAPKGRMRKINREIDLVKKRAQGNGLRDRLFHPDGATAGKAYNRNAEVDAYWHSERGRRKQEELWHVLPGRGGE